MPPTTTSESAFEGLFIVIARIWRLRFRILFFSFLFAAATWCYLKFLVKEIYRSEAVLLAADRVDSPALKMLVLSEDVLDTVRQKYFKKYPDEQGTPDLTKWVKRFDFSQEILEDTSVRKRYSPAVRLTVEAESKQGAQDLAQFWVDEVMLRFGAITYELPRVQVRWSADLIEKYRGERVDLVAREQEVLLRLAVYERRLSYLFNSLNNTVGIAGHVPGVAVTGHDGLNVELFGGGLLERKSNLTFDLARREGELAELNTLLTSPEGAALKSTPTGEQAAKKVAELKLAISGLRQEKAVVESSIVNYQDEITSLNSVINVLRGKLAQHRIDLDVATKALDVASDAFARNILGDAFVHRAPIVDGRRASKADLYLISPPSLPDRKIRPVRSLITIGAFAFANIFIVCVLALQNLLQYLPKELGQRRNDA